MHTVTREISAHHVKLCEEPLCKRHRQHVVFREEYTYKAKLTFECRGLPTWTIGWGDVGDWFTECRFDEIWLKIPTELCFRIRYLSWLRYIPWLGNILATRIAGVSGKDAYKNKDRWLLRVEIETTGADVGSIQ